MLVIGTQTPWVEAVLLSKKPRKVVTLEYGYYLRYITYVQLTISFLCLLVNIRVIPSFAQMSSVPAILMELLIHLMQYFHIPQLNTLDLVSFYIQKKNMRWLHV